MLQTAAVIGQEFQHPSLAAVAELPKNELDEALRALAAELPADRIMVETDAPYLAPGKFRGKRNEPSYVVEVARVLAETRGVSLEEISRQTTENFFRLFSKVPAPKATA